MKLAAIDIGSNAIRLQIVKVFEDKDKVSFKKLEFLRFPLRLGQEVFENRKISKGTFEKFAKLMQTFKLLIELYDVEAYSAVATSAMREATNGKEVQDYIQKKVGLSIKIISGKTEASILNKAIIPYLDKGAYIHIDVGGGSTELNLFHDRILTDNRSFKLGSVRKLSTKERTKTLADIRSWIKSKEIKKSKGITGIGTGGNINKLFKLANIKEHMALPLTELKGLRAYIKEFSVDERMSILKMNPDRADVIIPAAEIYINVLRSSGADYIKVPRVGLKDGLVYELFEKVSKKRLDQFEYIGEF